MRGNTMCRILALVPVALLAGLPLLAQQTQTGDPLADAARKAREEKKNAPKAKRVLTDDDIAPRPQTQPAPTEAAASGGEATAEKTDATKPKQDPNGETAWRKRFADQRSKIAKAQAELDVLERELQKADVQYYPDPQKALSEQLTRKDINTKSSKIDQKKQEIAQLQSELGDMEDQLRKSGGDPGWARQ